MNEYAIFYYGPRNSEECAIVEAETAEDAITVWQNRVLLGLRTPIPYHRIIPVMRYSAARSLAAATQEKQA